ncbi:MAG: dihydroorotate dehydrogenase electron transfer subunit [Actinomycetota bacterium]|nr:dihydroorotate dehydrogenase electron transfer subunit [Actinomycetota bacterium]
MTEVTGPVTGPVQVTGQVLTVKGVGAYCHLTLVAPGVAESFRPGSFVALSVGGGMSERQMRRTFPIYRVRASGAYGGTVEVVFEATEAGTRWLTQLDPSATLDVVGPLGRPFALPKEPVPCTLVGGGEGSAPLFALADRLRERGCTVHMVLVAGAEQRLFGALEAKRAARSILVTTEDGSMGQRGGVAEVLPGLLDRTGTDVVYACGPREMLHAVARAAEAHGAWSQTAVCLPMPCGTGVCMACVLPVVGGDGITRMVRSCIEGPVFRGDRVRWDDIGSVPEDTWGRSRPGSGS